LEHWFRDLLYQLGLDSLDIIIAAMQQFRRGLSSRTSDEVIADRYARPLADRYTREIRR